MSAELYTGNDFYDDIGGEDRHLDASYESRYEFLDDANDEYLNSGYENDLSCIFCELEICECESDLIE